MAKSQSKVLCKQTAFTYKKRADSMVCREATIYPVITTGWCLYSSLQLKKPGVDICKVERDVSNMMIFKENDLYMEIL